MDGFNRPSISLRRARTSAGFALVIARGFLVSVTALTVCQQRGQAASWLVDQSLVHATGRSGDSPQHVVELVVPETPDLSAALPVDVEVGGQPIGRVFERQKITIDLVDGKAALLLKYRSGLRLRTIVRREDTNIVLPAPQIAAVAVTDTLRLGVAHAELEANGGAGRFSWTSSATTSLTGRAVLAVPANAFGLTLIHISADGFAPRLDHIRLRANEQATIVLQADGTIRGVVVDRTHVSAATILRLWKGSGGRQRVLQRVIHKQFTLRAIPAGHYELELIVPAFGARTIADLVLTAGQDLDLGSLDITPNATLEGYVRDVGGTPLRGVRVRLPQQQEPAGAVPEARTDASGRYVFSRLLAGEYHPELYAEGFGWLTFPGTGVLVYPDQTVQQQFTLAASGCSLSIDFVPEDGTTAATYAINLPVTDAATRVTVGRHRVERRFPSVPCEGGALVRRLDADHERQRVSLDPGENRLTVPVWPPRSATLVTIHIGGRAIPDASVWIVPRDSAEVITKSASGVRTDASGQTMLMVPPVEEATVHLEVGGFLAIVERAQVAARDGAATLNLPGRFVSGTLIDDSSGQALAGVTVSGHVVPQQNGPDGGEVPVSAVTVFTGTTGRNGGFLVGGLAHGTWSIAFNATLGTRVISYETEFQVPSSDSNTPTLRIRVPKED